MNENRYALDRAGLLADVAEMYYLEGKNQSEIAQHIGVTRSMVSRLLKEARQRGIVEIRIHRTLESDPEIEKILADRFGLKDIYTVVLRHPDEEHLLNILGAAGAEMIKRHLKPDISIGLAWGTSISSVVDAVEMQETGDVRITQLVGAMGAQYSEYDGHALVSRLADKFGADGFFLNAPFICPNAETASSLMQTANIRQTLQLGQQAHIALLGIGSTEPQYSSFFLAGYVSEEELLDLRQSGAVGDVCGIHFNARGEEICKDFCDRLVAIRSSDIQNIPVRIGVAGGDGKALPILGALRGKLINVLVTDIFTAKKVLELDQLL